jgi:putative nucleotidyltransferase with HDIG domain
MPRDPSRTSSKTRRGELRRTIRRGGRLGSLGVDWQALRRTPAVGWGLLIWGVFTIVVGAAAMWTREQPLVAVGRIAHETRTVRTTFEVVDEQATDREREKARQQAPRVYQLNVGEHEKLIAELENLPRAVADVVSVDDVEAGLRERFGLTPDTLAAIQFQVEQGQVRESWSQRVRKLGENLLVTPLLDPTEYQVENTTPNVDVELRRPGGPSRPVRKGNVTNVQSAQLRDEMIALAARSTFQGSLLEVVVNRLTWQPKPNYLFDQAATTAAQDIQAAHVNPQKITHTEREIIFRRGDVVKAEQLELFATDLRKTRAAAQPWQVWLGRASVLGLVGAVALALAGYTILFCPRIRRNPLRVAAVAGLLGAAALVACWGTAVQPQLAALVAIAPTVFVSVILAIAYERRVALAYGSLHGLVVCVGLDQPVGMYALMIAGVGTAVWQLKEVRDRNTLIRMGVLEGLALGIGMLIAGVLELPVTPEALEQTAWDASLAAFGGLLVGGITLFILPTVERAFDITTGMTLIELRDPKQPLLRQLQQRAPGTYNHSLNVASLAEAAADSIGCNGLLTYVGALYHDIGKVNKPDYFVENQTPGFNKHDKLSPAMSLLVIVGHVKDGMELAREFGLPRALHHFIEAHHGTTLVEYFYHRARKQAAAADLGAGADGGGAGGGGGEGPEEIEYRYPGPKPRTREAAILMLCDAVESTARSMADPTPSRIDATVRAIATKRLMDGQFDESDLTLRELNIVVETVSKTLAAIYHGRIAYPSGVTSSIAAGAPGMAPAQTQPGVAGTVGMAGGVNGGAPASGLAPTVSQAKTAAQKAVERSA